MAESSASAAPDVIVFHGLDRELVDYFSALFESLGLSVAAIEDLPSPGGVGQDEKVDYYIEHAGYFVALVTYDPTGHGEQARPNVYDEIARARARRPGRLLLLTEQRDGRAVATGSNNERRAPVVLFDRSAPHLAVPGLLREMVGLQMVQPRKVPSDIMDAGATFNAFLDAMNHLWDNEFDEAWEKVDGQEITAEREVTHLLDRFFQQYLKVITAVARDGKRGDELRSVTASALEASFSLAAEAWKHAAELALAGLRQLQKQKKRPPKGELDAAFKAHRAARMMDTPVERISHYRKFIGLVDALEARHRSH